MNFLRGFSLNTASVYLVYALGLANAVLLANVLGPEAYGSLKWWTPVVVLGGRFLGEWLNKGNTYMVGRERARDAALTVTLVYCLGLGALLLLSAGWGHGLAESFREDISLALCLLAAGLITFTVLEMGCLAILLGEDRLKLYALIPVAFISCYLGGSLLLWHLDRLTLEAAMAVWLGAVGVAALAALVALFGRGARLSWGGRALFRRMLRVGGRGAVTMAALMLMWKGDVFLVERFLGTAAVGVYGVAVGLAEMIQRVPNVASAVLFSRVVRSQDSPRLFLWVALGMLGFAVLGAAGLLLIGERLLAVVFPEYTDAYEPLVWLLPGMLFSGLGAVFQAKLFGEGYPPVTMWAPAAAVVVDIGLNLWLIPSLGLRGAAISASVAYAVWGLTITTYYLRRNRAGW